MIADDAANIRRRARSVGRRRAAADEQHRAALEELDDLIELARDHGVSITELADLAGFTSTRALYERERRRAAS